MHSARNDTETSIFLLSDQVFILVVTDDTLVV